MSDSRLYSASESLIMDLCGELKRNPSVAVVRNALEALQKIENIPKHAREYTSWLLLEILEKKSNCGEELLVSTVIGCLQSTMGYGFMASLDDEKFLNKHLLNVILTITSKADPTLVKKEASENVKFSVLKYFTTLFGNVNASVSDKIYSAQYQAPLGHVIYILLQLTEEKESREVTLQAVDCLCAIMQCQNEGNEGLMRKVGDMFAAFLPGISIALFNVIRATGLRGQMVTVKALNGWTKCVAVVLDDDQVPCTQSCDETESEAGDKIVVKRTETWVKETAEKLQVLVEPIASLRSHSSRKVRLAVCKWTGTLLRKCRKSLAGCVLIFVEVLVTLSADEYDKIRMRSKHELDNLSQKLASEGQDIVNMMEENLHALVLNLPSIMKGLAVISKVTIFLENTQTLSTLSLLHGYLDFLKTKQQTLLLSSVLLQRLSRCLFQLTELDYSDSGLILENINSIDNLRVASKDKLTYPKRRFKYFKSEIMHNYISQLCRTLGKYGDLQLLVDHFLDKIRESESDFHPYVFLMNEMILGATENSGDLLWNIIDEYVCGKKWDVQTATRQTDLLSDIVLKRGNVLRVDQIKKNVAQLCLLLEGVGNCAKVLGSRCREQLHKILYPVLEKVEDESAVVCQAAYVTLEVVCESCGYQSLGEMFVKNCDIFLSPTIVKLRYSPSDCSSLNVFMAALKIGGSNLVPLVMDIVDDVLSCLDAFHLERGEIYLRVLLSFLRAVEKWHSTCEKEAKIPKVEDGKAGDNDLVKFLVEYDRLQRESVEFSDPVTNTDVEIDCDQNNEDLENCVEGERKPNPLHVTTTVKILDRCVHLMSTFDPRVRLLVLEIVDVGLRVLADHENNLLPIVHLLWGSLTYRFSDEKTFVIRKAFNVLRTMVDVCSEFLQGRFHREVWPSLLRYLEREARIRYSEKGSGFKSTVEFKLLTDILLNLGKMTVKLQVPELQCAELISVTLTNLSSNQPLQLQEASKVLYKHLAQWVPNLVWLQLGTVCDAFEILASGQTKAGESVAKCEYCKCALDVLEVLEPGCNRS